jgi:hypothetical protein
MIEKTVSRRGSAEDIYNCSMRLRFFENINRKCRASDKMDINCHVFADSRWEMLLNTTDQLMGNVKRSVERPLGNSQWLLDSFWAILKVYWKATGKCQNN